MKFRDEFVLLLGLLGVTSSSFIILLSGDSSGLMLDRIQLAFFRVFFTGFTSYFLLRRVIRRDNGFRSSFTGVNLLLILLSGISLALHFSLWFLSLDFLPVGVSLSLTNTAPVWLLLFSFLLHRSFPSFSELSGIFCCVLGIFVIGLSSYFLSGSSLGLSYVGVLLALFSGFSLSIYLGLASWGVNEYGLWKYFGLVNLSSAVFIFLYILFFQDLASIGVEVIFYGVLLALVPGLVGHASFQYSMSKLPSSLVSSATLGEPVLGAVVAWLFLGQALSYYELLSIFLVLLGLSFLLLRKGNSELALE